VSEDGQREKKYFFKLAVPPTINSRLFRPFGKRRMVLSDKHREYKEYVQLICMQRRIKPLQGPVEVRIKWFKGDKRRSDIDNRWKALLDGFTGFAYADDSQIQKLVVEKIQMEKSASMIEVEIEQL